MQVETGAYEAMRHEAGHRRQRQISPLWGVKRMAFCSRLTSVWRIFTASPSTTAGRSGSTCSDACWGRGSAGACWNTYGLAAEEELDHHF